MVFVITTDHLSKQFSKRNTQPAIDDLSMNIPQGILFGLVGPDGAGKTTRFVGDDASAELFR